MRRPLLGLLGLVVLAACGGGSTGSSSSKLTYYHDVKPIIDGVCIKCHQDGQIAPFPLKTYDDVFDKIGKIHDAVQNRVMPPWHAADGCNEYLDDQRLTDAQINTIVTWIDEGAAMGDPADEQPPIQRPTLKLSRRDVVLKNAEAYTPNAGDSDDYRCFVVDWPSTYTKTEYITGFEAIPGTPAIVHHVIAYLIPPSAASDVMTLDANDPGPGYTCYGGPGNVGAAVPGWIGAWAPGGEGNDFPDGTGLPIDPGSKIVIQVHYNLSAAKASPDQTQVAMKVDDSVAHLAMTVPFTNYDWVLNHTMDIPAGNPDVMHSVVADPTPYLGFLSGGTFPAQTPYVIYGLGLHMHQLGTHATLAVKHADGTTSCLLTANPWDFHWQGGYELKTPITFQSGDQLSLECHWDNSLANQPVDASGNHLAPHDVNWGESTKDEMCLGVLYIAQP